MELNVTDVEAVLKRNKVKKRSNILKHKALYLMALPGIIYYIVFRYLPMLGIVIAFQNYKPILGFSKSAFVGFDNFKTLFGSGDFTKIFLNSIIINFYDILFGFTAPIILALLLNEVINAKFKRTVQSIIYLPHFLSWVVLGGIISTQFLSMDTGMINHVLKFFGQDPVYFLTEPKYARLIVILSGIWKDVGWGTVIYLAALAGIDPGLYEAASIDGAGRMRQLFSITLPSLASVIIVLLLLKVGHFLDFGFERVYVFLNGANSEKIEIFDTFIYKTGVVQALYSYSTAISIFKSTVGIVLLTFSNFISKKYTGESLY